MTGVKPQNDSQAHQNFLRARRGGSTEQFRNWSSLLRPHASSANQGDDVACPAIKRATGLRDQMSTSVAGDPTASVATLIVSVPSRCRMAEGSVRLDFKASSLVNRDRYSGSPAPLSTAVGSIRDAFARGPQIREHRPARMGRASEAAGWHGPNGSGCKVRRKGFHQVRSRGIGVRPAWCTPHCMTACDSLVIASSLRNASRRWSRA